MELHMSRFLVRMAGLQNQGGNLPRPVTTATEAVQDRTSRCKSDHRSKKASAGARLVPGYSRNWALGLAALLLTASGAQAQAVFSAQPVGATSGVQNVTVSAQIAGAVSQVEVLTLGVSGLDFEKGIGALTCETAVFTAANQTCMESVTFTPAAPGLRIGAVVLLDINSNVLGTAYLSGTGLGGLGVLVPGAIQTAAGDGQWVSVHDGGLATLTDLDLPSSVTIDSAGNMYIADSAHNRIRKVAAPVPPATVGIISTIAGTGDSGYLGDGFAAVNATLNIPSGVALDGAGNLYIADTGNNAVRKIAAATGIITTVAGNGTPGSAGDGSTATLAELDQPWGVTVDITGNLYIADTANQRIRRVDAVTRIITTVAGNGNLSGIGDGKGTFSGDGGQAAQAGLSLPHAVAFDSSGNMYIPDSANNRIRKVTAVNGIITTNSVISTFAGNGTPGFSGDGGAAIYATLNSPSGVVFDSAGNVYIADTQNNRIRKVSTTNQDITTIAGNGLGGYGGDNGSATAASMYGPYGLSLDGNGNLFLADYFDHRIREIRSNLAILDFTLTPVRQGDKSAQENQTVENDGNAPLDLTAITTDQNAALGAANTCTTGNPFLAVDADCVIGAVFAPSPLVTPTNPETGNIDIGHPGDTGNLPLDIQLIGNATAVNSTTIALVSSLDPSAFGQNVTFTATVTTGVSTGNLTGTVTFYDGAATLAANVPLNAPGTTATATYTTPALTVGLHTITASYNGDTLHFSSKSTDNSTPPLIQTVLEGTATNLASSVNPSSVGQNVIFTASVKISGGGGVAPDGTVVIYDGATILGSVALNANGVATYSTSTLANGLHAITAAYGGDASKQIELSTSAVLNQDVQAPASTAVTSTPNPSIYGTPVTFTATVTPSGTVAPAGAVNFLDGGVQIGTANLVGATGQTTFTTSSLVVGSHTITAAYQGGPGNGASTSLPITQTVNQAQTATTVHVVPNPGIAGAAVAITATVTVTQGIATPAGNVTFADTFSGATVTLGSATLGNAGAATIHPTLAPGAHSIVATYAGDVNDNGSASPAYALTVNLATTSIVVTATPNPALVLAAVTFTAKVTGNGGVPTGSVSFLADGTSMGATNLDGTGTATFTYSALPAGSHSITVSYAGDANDSPSTSAAIAQVVGTIPTVTALGVSTTTGNNSEVILVATVLDSTGPAPTGTITFNSGTTVLGTAPLDSSGVATLTPNLATGTYSIVAVYSGDALHSPSTSQAVTIPSTPTGFNLTVTPANVTVATTQNTVVTVTLTSNVGFADTIGLGCASLPAGVTCHFSSISVGLAANGIQTAQLTIDTNYPLTGGSAAKNTHTGNRSADLAGLLLPFSAFFGWILWRFRRRNAAVITIVLVLLLSGAAMLATGCSGIGSSSAAPGTYVIQVTGTGANSNMIHYQNVTLTITK
jgi:sugar lactone lactonase YvrE